MILHKRVIITLHSGYTAVPKRGIRPVLSLGSPCSRTEKPVFLFFNQSGRIFRRKKDCCTPLRQFFLCHRKLLSYDIKTLREDRTAAEWKMSLARPAAGGESCKAGFFLATIQSSSTLRNLKSPKRKSKESGESRPKKGTFFMKKWRIIRENSPKFGPSLDFVP